MVIDLKGMCVIYKENIYRALAILKYLINGDEDRERKSTNVKIKYMTVMVLNEDAQVMILEDEAWMFQFLMEAKPN